MEWGANRLEFAITYRRARSRCCRCRSIGTIIRLVDARNTIDVGHGIENYRVAGFQVARSTALSICAASVRESAACGWGCQPNTVGAEVETVVETIHVRADCGLTAPRSVTGAFDPILNTGSIDHTLAVLVWAFCCRYRI